MAAWQNRLRDAQRFWEVAEAVSDPDHGNQAASNAILAAIAANDAVCLYLGGRQPSGRSHTEAAQVLQAVCAGTRWAEEATMRARQLVELLRWKNAAQYEGRLLSAEEVQRVLRQAERFMAWAERVLSPRANAV